MANEIEIEYINGTYNGQPRWAAEITIGGHLVHRSDYSFDMDEIKRDVLRRLKDSAKVNRKNVETLDEQYDNLMAKIEELT